MNLVIVDYDMGNLASVKNALRAVGLQAEVSADPEVVAAATALVLPGMGSFGNGMASLRARGLIEPIKSHVAAARPLLGICLGMQLLFETGEEFGARPGLGLLKGSAALLPSSVKLPHIGWNTVDLVQHDHPIFAGLPASFHVYFDHSYAPVGEDPADVAATTDYGRVYASMVARGNIIGAQFHPEKSSRVGLKILENFGRIVCRSNSIQR